MRIALMTLALLAFTAASANDNKAQQAPLPMKLDNMLQGVPQLGDDAMQIPAITPEMQRLLMQQAERQAAQEAARAVEDTSNARIQDTQRQQ